MPTALADFVANLGGHRQAAALLGINRTAVTVATQPDRPSLAVRHLRTLAGDNHAALSALLADRAARLADPVVEVPYSPGTLSTAVALAASVHHDNPTALRAALASILNT